ncbi:putative clathrin assembly protein At4g40080 [Impatiens glandulifera]|uniref:putative clathrin assembly protein At4g40080 n=1 Tax=Impatiens glandulifera TaxID=253017 RepID=UPI001FB18C04|nr:putative clathrin assembly protein At4g40080 [Impatiens glandulifera]
MGRRKSLREVVGLIKDKASQSKALFSNPTTLPLHLAVLRATAHSPHAPPQEQHILDLLLLGDSSRATASALIKSLMNRLHHTSNAAVALKCLIIIHHIIKRGPFILQDQLSIFPATGGRNYLNLSAFHDGSTPSAWIFSNWVRYYARYLETLLSTSRNLGFFLGSYSSTVEKDRQEERLSSFVNRDLIREIDSLVGLMEDICKIPDNLHVKGVELLLGITGFIGGDYLSVVKETVLRVIEFKERVGSMSFGQSVELTCALKRLEDCRERMEKVIMIPVRKLSMETLWVLTEELKEIMVGFDGGGGGGKEGRKIDREKMMRTESARLENRFLDRDNAVKFNSTRFGDSVKVSSNGFNFLL